MESTQQDTGGAARYRRQRSKSVQSARSAFGLCDNLIRALLLLVLRSSIEMDKHSALDVVICAKVSGFSRSRGRNFSEDYSEALREGADDLKVCIIVEHIEVTDGYRRLWTQIGTLSAKQLKMELKGVNGKSCTMGAEMITNWRFLFSAGIAARHNRVSAKDPLHSCKATIMISWAQMMDEKNDDQNCTLWSKWLFFFLSIHDGARPRHLARPEGRVQVRARRLREHGVTRGVVGAHPLLGVQGPGVFSRMPGQPCNCHHTRHTGRDTLVVPSLRCGSFLCHESVGGRGRGRQRAF